MRLELNLGDVLIDTAFNVKIIIAAMQDENGEAKVLAGYEDNTEVVRVFPYIVNHEGRVAIVQENLGEETDAVLGDGYYTWVEDPSLVYVTE